MRRQSLPFEIIRLLAIAALVAFAAVATAKLVRSFERRERAHEIGSSEAWEEGPR